MKKYIIFIVMIILFIPTGSYCDELTDSEAATTEISHHREVIIENFDSGVVELESYPGEDEDPADWQLDSVTTYWNSPYSIKLFGNTWKVENIQSEAVDSGEVWQVSALIDSEAEIQGFGIMDSANVLFYSFAGSEELNIEEWIPVYQGNFSQNEWNEFLLPVADDWVAFFDYLPEITSIVFINDRDETDEGVSFFDNIINITEDLLQVPQVEIDYDIGDAYSSRNGARVVDVEFYGEVVDPDSDDHNFFWDFGDDSTSTIQNPIHTFLVTDDHPYTVLFRAVDSTNMWGQASCSIEVDEGATSFPITLNFVGDIMLARHYEEPGGIIPTQGVEAIFEPTLEYLGDAADITVANLECPLTTHWEHHPTKTIYFKSSPENVDGLTYAGIDIVSLANNHILDYMLPGIVETQSVLQMNDIIYSGAGANSYEGYLPAFFSKSGINFAFLATSDRTGQYNNYQPYLNSGFNKPGFAYMTPYYIRKQIEEVEDISDFVVMEWHCGSEYSRAPGSNYDGTLPFAEDCSEEEDYFPLIDIPHMWDREIRHFAIDNGADLVICHHPHIIQGVELYNGKLIAHSLGNFAFDLSYPETFPTMILNSKVDESGFYEFSITPIYIDDYIPQRAEGGLGLHILDQIAFRSKQLSTYLKVDREEVIGKVIMDTLSMLTQETYQTVELPLEEVSGSWRTPPHPLELEGSIEFVSSIQPFGMYEFRLGREKVWFGNMEDEGCTLWNLNSSDEDYCDSVAYAGERSIQHSRIPSSGDNIVTNFERRIICRSDTIKYSLCGFIKTHNGSDVTVEIRYYENRSGGEMLGEENIGTSINGNTPWTFYFNDLTIPEGTEFFDIRLNSDIPNIGTALSWFDNVSIIRWDNWGEYSISQSIPCPNDYYFIQTKSQQNVEEVTVNYTEIAFNASQNVTGESENQANVIFNMSQNFPNPFDSRLGKTNISFNLNKAVKVKAAVYNIKGQRVKTLVDNFYQPGTHNLIWDGTNSQEQRLGSGIYFYKIDADNESKIKKCILLR